MVDTTGLEAAVQKACDTIDALREQVRSAQAALEHDRTKVAECVTAIKEALHNYEWLIEGRGSYEWDDDRWHGEFSEACKNIRKAFEPMVKIAADWSNCPTKREEIERARHWQPSE